MSSNENDRTTILNYIASNDEFRNTHARTMLHLISVSKDMKLIAEKCTRQLELEKAIASTDELTSNALKIAESRVQETLEKLKARKLSDRDYAEQTALLFPLWTQYSKDRDQLKKDLETKHKAPLQKELNDITTLLLTNRQLIATQAGMMTTLVDINKELPPGQKLKLNASPESLIAKHFDKINTEMQARIDAHADTLTQHVCANTKLTVLFTAYQLAQLNLDNTTADIEPIRAAFAQAIRDTMSECCICCDNIANGQSATTTCKHTFHRSCLGTWLAHGKTSCPMCRGDVVAKDLVFK
jgi:hypothetical protein